VAGSSTKGIAVVPNFNLRSDGSVVLLGAGASVEAGLPTSNELTRRVLTEAENEPRDEVIRKLYRIIAGGILFRFSKNGRNPLAVPVNVEDIAEALALLDRHEHWKFGALFGGVDPAILALEERYGSAHHVHSVAKRITEVLEADGKKRGAVIETLARQIVEPGFIFPSIYRMALQELREFCFQQLSQPTQSIDYLQPLAKCRGIRCVATLNFDTLFEQACQRVGRSIDVGVFRWNRGHLKFEAKSTPFLKLHGSIDWCSVYDEDALEEDGRPVGPNKIIQGTPNHGFLANKRPTVLFGTPSKLTADGPYLDLLHRFERELERVSKVAVIGYSFADAHINQVLRGWLSRSRENELSIASSNRFFSSWEEKDIFFQEWNPDQVAVTRFDAGEAISAWCG
jgi:NAD-dependent SIR2 family protein deacetylase